MIKKLMLSLVALLLALLGAELLIRGSGAAPEMSIIHKGRFQLSANPRIGFEPVPRVDYAGHDLSFYDYQGSSNSLGYRDTEHAVAKPPGVYRVVVLGDSIAAGLKVERLEDTFPPILEGLLRQAGVDAEVINLAVSGYNTQQEVETLKDKGLRYRPDLVLVAYSLTDRERVDGDILKTLLEIKLHKEGTVAQPNSYLLDSALYRFVRYRVLAAHQRPAVTEPALQAALDLISGDTVAEYFGVLAGLAKESHFQVLIAVFPRLVRNFHAYRFIDQHQYVAALSAQHGFQHLDLLDTMARCREHSPEPIGADNWHPAAAGHRCAAAAMAQAILDAARPPRR